MKKLILVLAAVALSSAAFAQGYLPNRAPLTESRFMELPLGAVKADGWLQQQLLLQKEGLSGNLDEVYPNVVGKRNNSHDWWPKMVALKIIKQYYMATGDDRVVPFLDKYFRYQLAHLPEVPLDHWTFWGAQRGGDNLEIVYWQQSGQQKQIDAVKSAEKFIRSTIGLPTGLWAGDELLNYGDPIRGSELCTAIEMMFSLEEILRITGDAHWADWLERVAISVRNVLSSLSLTDAPLSESLNSL